MKQRKKRWRGEREKKKNYFASKSWTWLLTSSSTKIFCLKLFRHLMCTQNFQPQWIVLGCSHYFFLSLLFIFFFFFFFFFFLVCAERTRVTGGCGILISSTHNSRCQVPPQTLLWVWRLHLWGWASHSTVTNRRHSGHLPAVK